MSRKRRKKPVAVPTKFDVKSAFIYYCTPKVNGTLRSYKDVAKKFDVSVDTVERWGKRNSWVRNRLDAGERQVQKFFDERDKIAKETDKKQFRNLDMLEKGVMNAIQMLLGTQQSIVENDDIGVEDKIRLMKQLKMQSVDLRNLADSLKTAQNQKRIILGMPTEISKADIKNLNLDATLSDEDIAEMDEFMRKNNVGNKKAS